MVSTRATASVIQTAQVDRAVAVAMKNYDADAVDADTIAAEERNLANQFAALQASLDAADKKRAAGLNLVAAKGAKESIKVGVAAAKLATEAENRSARLQEPCV